jgi:transposase
MPPKTSPHTTPVPSSKRNRFTDEQKQNAVRLIDQEGYTKEAAAKAIGCAKSAIHRWHVQYGRKPAACGPDASHLELIAENKRLREQLRRTEMEREILKKATAYFAGLKP